MKKWFEPARAYALKGGASVAEGLLQLTLSVLIAFFLFRDGDAIVARLRGAVGRIAPDRGLHMLQVARDTTRAVVYGILGTALAQGVLMAIGLWIAGFKAAPLLGLLTFFLSPVPVGPPLVWIPTSLMLIMRGDHAWGAFLFLWGFLVVSTVDNFIRPMIISYGTNLPFILVLLGVFGGVVAFGFIGVFLGPVLLALGFALIKEWAGTSPSGAAGAPSARAEPDGPRSRRLALERGAERDGFLPVAFGNPARFGIARAPTINRVAVIGVVTVVEESDRPEACRRDNFR